MDHDQHRSELGEPLPSPGEQAGGRAAAESGRRARRWTRRNTVTAAVVATGLAVTGGVAFATTGNPSPGSRAGSAAAGYDAPGDLAVGPADEAGGRPGGKHGGKHGDKHADEPGDEPGAGPGGEHGGRHGHGGPRGLGRLLHGEFVATTPTGTGTVTEFVQRGTVTAVSATSISLKSSDGFSRTYVVTSATSVDHGRAQISDIAAGDVAGVLATVSGDTATATRIEDRNRARPPAPQATPPPTGQPTPTPTG